MYEVGLANFLRCVLTILRTEDLDFTRRHLERFEDSDFFPRFPEYQAIWSDWDSFKTNVQSKNIAKLQLSSALSMPVAKGLSTYRIVHQLEPLTSIVYTALAHRAGPAVEQARAEEALGVACSNRFAAQDGAFFSRGSGYDTYKKRGTRLAVEHAYVATADVSDFFNQIYSHRVRASIEAADPALGGIAEDVEHVIHAINAGASKGIPIGSDASRLFAEGIMIDVDQLIARRGLEHSRYVDDIRIFSDDEQELRSIIEELSDYLYSNHRLNLNSQKTGVYPNLEYIRRIAPDHKDDETNAAMARLSLIDPYGESGLEEFELPDEEILAEIASIIDERANRDPYVDHNLLKAFLRRSRYVGSLAYVEVADRHPETFVPVFHELAKAMENSIKVNGPESIAALARTFRMSAHYRRRAVSMWLNWVSAGSPELLTDNFVRAQVFSAGIRTQARAAATVRDLAWIRARREDYRWMSPTDRMAAMASFRLLGADERKAIVRQIDDNQAGPVELALKRWVLAG